MSRRLARLLPAALLLVATGAHAQRSAADTLPFHAGQWGVEAGVGAGGGVGALRFFSRATALTLDLSAAYNERTNDVPATVGGSNTFTNTSVAARVGVRHYAPLAASLAGLFTVGGTVSHTRSHSDPGDVHGHDTGVGAFAEAGASYFVTPRLALSGTYGLTVQHTSGDLQQVFVAAGQQVAVDTRGWFAATTGVRLTAAIFF